jgi:hypothetical protein
MLNCLGSRLVLDNRDGLDQRWLNNGWQLYRLLLLGDQLLQETDDYCPLSLLLDLMGRCSNTRCRMSTEARS